MVLNISLLQHMWLYFTENTQHSISHPTNITQSTLILLTYIFIVNVQLSIKIFYHFHLMNFNVQAMGQRGGKRWRWGGREGRKERWKSGRE